MNLIGPSLLFQCCDIFGALIFQVCGMEYVVNSYEIVYIPVCRGQAKFCLIFCILHLFVGIWKRVTSHPSVLVASTCLSLTSSIFSFSFETWMVVQHEKVC